MDRPGGVGTAAPAALRLVGRGHRGAAGRQQNDGDAARDRGGDDRAPASLPSHHHDRQPPTENAVDPDPFNDRVGVTVTAG
ncbi:hypothetical protein GCM10010219_17230 [Streptomyces netropsis]|nr:hypothetical protein GCM10010219_17230 [Streptomyces netropsis]